MNKLYDFERVRLGRLILGVIRKHFLQWHFKNSGDAKRQFQGWRIFILLHRDDRLTRHPNFFSQLLLGHLIAEETQLSYVVADPTFTHIRIPSGTESAARYPRSPGQELRKRSTG